ncbi:hypothetical protein THRCLA_22390 [Thraustotheca clavata]|uniref:Uncharacterized protein n=1 Tax=Thraustotheca clavata TaxID=74557 RepID=A0A1V9Z2W3_9STRA|nr:hypothetical protein THRCLA_22390 [Thraustotheca clavata]
MQDHLVTGARTAIGIKAQQLSPRLNYALKNTQGGVKGNTISLIKQSEANRRAISQSRRSSLAASRQRRLSSTTPISQRANGITAPQPQYGGISPRSRKASARAASNLPTKWKSGDDVLVRESDSSLDFLQGTVHCSSGFKRYTIILDDASVMVDVSEDSIYPLSSIADTTKLPKESQIQPAQETIVQEIQNPVVNEPQLLVAKLQSEPSNIPSWNNSSYVSALSSDIDQTGQYVTKTRIVQGMLIQRLVAIPVLKPEPVVLSEPIFAVIVGNVEFTIHERVIVPDSTVPGVIVEIVSTRIVVVEFDDDIPVPGFNSDLSDDQLPRISLFRVGDWVLVTHPSGKRLEKGRIASIEDLYCDVEFSEGDIVRQIPLSFVQATGSTNKPGCFHLLDYVLVSNPRFERYCTAQITFVNATTNPPTYNVVFDYGEAMTGVSHNYVTTLDDPKVLTPDRKLTNVWDSVLGWEAIDVTWFECHGNIALHRMICMHKRPRQTLQVGDPVYARYHDSDKYFLAVIEELTEKGIAKVVFASTQIVEELSIDKMFSVAPSKPRPFTAPIVTPQRYTLAQRSSQSKLRAPMKPKQEQKPSILQRLRSFFVSRQPAHTRTNPQRTKNTGTRRSSIIKLWAK